MAIPAQRVKYLDHETNVGSVGFTSGMSSDIYTASQNLNEEFPSELFELVDSASQTDLDVPMDIQDEISTAMQAASRNLKGAISAVADFRSLPNKMLDGAISEIGSQFPGAAKGLKSLMQSCGPGSFNGGMGVGKPWDISMNCGNGKIGLGKGSGGSGCNAVSYNDILNKATGGAYNAVFQDLNKLVSAAMGLAKMGYGAGMCGILGALTKGMGGDVLGRVTGGLLANQGLAGNVNAVFDIAKTAMNVKPLLTVPGAASMFLNNFTKPKGMKDSGFSSLGASTLGAVESIKEDAWYDDEGVLNIGIADKYREDLGDTFGSMLTDRTPSLSSLNTVPDDDMDYIQAGYMATA